jgi:hypothetical protein
MKLAILPMGPRTKTPKEKKEPHRKKQSLGAAKETQTLEDPSNEHIPTTLKHQSHFN